MNGPYHAGARAARAAALIPVAAGLRGLRGLVGQIGVRLADEHNDRQEIAETAAERLHDLAAALAAGAAPVVALDTVQLETALDALDAAIGYRQQRGSASCGEGNDADPGRCDDHARDVELVGHYDALSR
jgi:hypothetical protein